MFAQLYSIYENGLRWAGIKMDIQTDGWRTTKENYKKLSGSLRQNAGQEHE